MDIQLERPARVRTRLGTSLRRRRRTRPRSLGQLAALALALGVTTGLMLGAAVNPGAWSAVVLGAGVLVCALLAGLERA